VATLALLAAEKVSRRSLTDADHRRLIEEINLSSVERRLGQALLRLSEGKREIVLTMTKGDLASQIGMSQETLSRKLSAFQDQGLIELKGQRTIRILDRDGLSEII